MSKFIKMMLKCNLFLVLKKYVPGITHQLCTVANWNPQLSKDFLLSVGGIPTKAIELNKRNTAKTKQNKKAHLSGWRV